MTRWLLGIGGCALALQGVRQKSITGGLLAGIGTSLAWCALSGEGDLSEARRRFTHLAGARRMDPERSRARRIGRLLPGQRCPGLDVDGRHRSQRAGAGALMLRAFRIPSPGRTCSSGRRSRSWRTTAWASRRSSRATSFSRSSRAAVPRRRHQLHAGQRPARRRSPPCSPAWRQAKCSSIVQDQLLKIANDKSAGLLTLGHARHDLELLVGHDRHRRHAEPGVRHPGKPAVVESAADGGRADHRAAPSSSSSR